MAFYRVEQGFKRLEKVFPLRFYNGRGLLPGLCKVFHSASGFNMHNLFFVSFSVCGSGVVVEGEGVVEGSPASLHSQHHCYHQ